MYRKAGTRSHDRSVTRGLFLGTVLLLTMDAWARPHASSFDALQAMLDEGRYADVETRARQELAALAATDDSGRRSADYLDLLVEARLRGARGASNETLQLSARAVDLRKTLNGPTNARTAMSLTQHGQVLEARDEPATAGEAYESALAILRSQRGSHAAEYAWVQLRLASRRCERGTSEESPPTLAQSVKALAAVLGPRHPEVAEALQSKARCESRLQDDARAAATARQALHILEESLGSTHPRTAAARVTLGSVLNFANSLEESREQFERALSIYTASAGSGDPLLMEPLEELAWNRLAAADWSAAADFFERVLAIQRRELGLRHGEVGRTLVNIGIVRNDMSDALGAIDAEASGLQILRETFGPRHPQVAWASRNLGVALASVGRFDEAEALLSLALEVVEASYGTDSPRLVNTLRNLGGNLYLAQGRYDDAVRTLERALAIERATGGDGSMSVAYLEGYLANARLALGDPERALQLARDALAVHQAQFGSRHPDNAVLLETIASALAKLGRIEESARSAALAVSLGRQHFHMTAPLFTEQQALTVARSSSRSMDLLLTLATNHQVQYPAIVPLALDAVIRSRAVVFDELVARNASLFLESDPAVTAAHARFREASRDLSQLVFRGPAAADVAWNETKFASAVAEREQAEHELAALSARYRQRQTRPDLGLDAVMTGLPGNGAIVAYVRFHLLSLDAPWAPGTPAYSAFSILAGASTPHLVHLGPADAMERAIENWRDAIHEEAVAGGGSARAAERSYRVVAGVLRSSLWDPVARDLSGGKQVFVVPDGAINLVSFASLPESSGRYVADAPFHLHYLTAERDILTATRTAAAARLLAMGDPDFDESHALQNMAAAGASLAERDILAQPLRLRGSCGSPADLRFGRLNSSREEVMEVAAHWARRRGTEESAGEPSLRGAAELLTGPAASEAAFRGGAHGYSVLHLATHGYFEDDRCAAVPAQGGPAQYPLLRSALIFAGANSRQDARPSDDDGILTAAEIATVDLSKSDWAVLSACGTGLGRIHNGEGVFGLRRAFQLAGVRTVIMSLWSVEDDATRRWMTALYRHRFSDGRDTATAVSDASREMLMQRRATGESTHPFYWAGFIATGDWR